MHLLITALLTAVMGTGWAMMGRFGLVSFGHGAFLGAAAYTMALLWNDLGLTPWLGIPIGIGVAAEKLKVTVISVALAALAGALTAQYRQYLNPESLAGLGISLQIVFSAIAGGMYAPLGPTIGAIITIGLEEGLRIAFGTEFTGGAPFIYGI